MAGIAARGPLPHSRSVSTLFRPDRSNGLLADAVAALSGLAET
jgi:hypothetical protein